jgi:hypothetical protein
VTTAVRSAASASSRERGHIARDTPNFTEGKM